MHIQIPRMMIRDGRPFRLWCTDLSVSDTVLYRNEEVIPLNKTREIKYIPQNQEVINDGAIGSPMAQEQALAYNLKNEETTRMKVKLQVIPNDKVP